MRVGPIFIYNNILQKPFYKRGPNSYVISSDGKVTNKRTSRVLKTLISRGYESLAIGSKNFTIHRLVAKAYIPNPLHKPTINHIDSDRANNDVSNLEWASHKENTAHAIAIGRHKSVVNASKYRIIRYMLITHTVEEVSELTGLTVEEVARFI